MYGNMTYYPIMSCTTTLNEVNAFKSFMIVGNNGIHTAMTGISWASVTKMSKNENVSMEILLKVCEALSCGIEDVVEFVPDDAKEEHGA